MSRPDIIINSTKDIVRSDDHDCDLIVVVPVYKNAKTLGILVDEIHKVLDDSILDHRILIVDDASPDDSWSILCGLCDRDSRVGGIRLRSNSGQHLALITGLSLCSSPWVAIMDADLQDNPELLSKLFEKARISNATVYAERYGQYESWSRMFTSRVFKTALGWITGVPSRCGTFFLTSERVIKKMLEYDIPVVQVVIMSAFASSSIDTVSFERAYRAPNESGYTFYARLKAALRGLQCAFFCMLSRKGWKGSRKYKLPFIAERVGWMDSR